MADLPGFSHLLATIARLRAPDGCPWDRKQTTASMAPCLLEEAFEASDALRRGATDEAREELGDVLVNVAMIGQIASEDGRFGADDVARDAADKLIRRHPHVFGGERADDAENALQTWERQKQREKAERGLDRSALSGVPTALPALLRAFRVGQKAAKVGFDWPDRDGPRRKLDEELGELDDAIQSGDEAAIADELGDVLFSVCNLARHLGVNPETALAGTADKFQRRFAAVERAFDYQLEGRDLEALEAAWRRAKADEAADPS
ncbi:MAG: nucleoside triphosphate pyrophosphohydrolase [Planctomycetes bacterium]|nr:nucleoside triphosphate pyrophosphohydrolase [Planctomycetota bacterium]